MLKRLLPVMLLGFIVTILGCPGQPCGPERIYDCNRICVDETERDNAVDDGICDEDFNCRAFEFDGGDCSNNETTTTSVPETTTTTTSVPETTTTTTSVPETTTTTTSESNFPAPVQRTGQTQCYHEDGANVLCRPCVIGGGCYPTGQDGMWQKGVALPEPRFTDNADGTITDNLTGLNWMENANCFDFNTWQEALDHCNDLSAGTCGLTDGSSVGDWRLPNRRELFSLIDDGFAWPSIPNTAGTEQWSEGDPFYNLSGPDRQAKTYWSSTTCMNILDHAWYVVMSSGVVDHEIKSSVYRAWCVKGGH